MCKWWSEHFWDLKLVKLSLIKGVLLGRIRQEYLFCCCNLAYNGCFLVSNPYEYHMVRLSYCVITKCSKFGSPLPSCLHFFNFDSLLSPLERSKLDLTPPNTVAITTFTTTLHNKFCDAIVLQPVFISLC